MLSNNSNETKQYKKENKLSKVLLEFCKQNRINVPKEGNGAIDIGAFLLELHKKQLINEEDVKNYSEIVNMEDHKKASL